MALAFESVDEILQWDQCFPVELFIMLYKVALIVEAVEEKCDP